MNEALLLSVGKIFASVALLAAVLFTVSRVGRRLGLSAEVSRKLIHVSLGLYCITFPWVFSATWEVAATCGLAAVLFLLARGRLRTHLGEGLHGVKRISYGELLFALSVVLLFELRDGHFITVASSARAPDLVLYVLPLLVLTLCDAASAVVGSAYGRRRFQVEEGIKSWEGVVVFVVLAWLFSLITLLLFSDVGRGDAIVLALITALFGALLEAASWRGLDNFFIPLGLYFILSNLMMRGTETLLLTMALFGATLAGVVLLGRRTALGAHWLATAATLLFCIAIFSGPESILTPLAALFAYTLSIRLTGRERPVYDPLNLLLTVLGMALGFYLISDFAHRDVIFGFNLAFACLAVAIAAHFRVRAWALAVVAIIAYAALAVRTWVMIDFDLTAWQFHVFAVVAILAVMVLARLSGGAGARRPWVTLGGLSMAAGLGALTAAPA